MNTNKFGFTEQNGLTENLNKKITIITSWNWVIWLLLLALFLGFILWSIFGYVKIRQSGTGIIVPHPSKIYEADAQGNGIITQSNIKIGNKVKKGEVLAKISLLDLEDSIKQTESYLQALEVQKEKIFTHLNDERKKLLGFNDKYTKALDTQLNSSLIYKSFMDQFIKKASFLMDKGAISEIDFQRHRNNLFQLENSIKKTFSDMAQFQFDMSKYEFNFTQMSLDLEVKIVELSNKLQNMKSEIKVKQYIKSPLSGTVTQVFKNSGAFISEGQVFATILSDGKKLGVMGFFPATTSKMIQKGMEAFVSPTIANKELYGTIVGKVIEISEYPLSVKNVAGILQDEDLAQTFCKQGAPLLGKVSLEIDTDTVSGFKWTSAQGPKFKITNGTVCQIDVVVEQKAPISLIIPYIRSYIGVGYE